MKIQQGDVIIKTVDEITGHRIQGLTLAEGEATGHHHTVTKGDAELYNHEGTLFLRVLSETATVTHQEHDAIVLPTGDYQISRVREMDWVNEEIREVRD